MHIFTTHIGRLIVAALKLLLGVLWLFTGDLVIQNWGYEDYNSMLYWFINGAVLGIVIHGLYGFVKELLFMFDIIPDEHYYPLSVFNKVIDENNYGVCLKSLEGKYLLANNRYCDIHGIDADQLLGKTDHQFMEAHAAIKSRQDEDKVIKTNKPLVEEIDVHQDGTVQNFRVTKSLLKNDRGHAVGVYIVYKDITDYVEIQNRSRVLEDRYRRLFDELPYPAMLLDPVTTLASEFNDAMLEMLGYKRGEFMRTRMGLYLAEEQAEDAIDFIDKLIKQQGGVLELKLVTKDKNEVDVEAHFRLINIRNNDYLHTIFRDITENKQATQALIESEQNYHTLFNHANDAIFIIDPITMAILDANELAYIWLGYDADELKALTIFDVDKAGLESVTREKLNELAQHKEVLFEHELCSYQGDIVPVEISAHPVIYNQKLAYEYVVRDISERKVAEWALKESEERYWQMFEYNSAIMLVIDPVRRTIEDANDSAVRFYHIPKGQLIGSSFDNICLVSSKPRASEGIDNNINSKSFYEATHKLGNNDIRFVEVNEAPIEIHGRQLNFTIIRDVTKIKEAANQIELANKMLDSTSEGVLVVNTDFNVVSVNNAFKAITGFTDGDLISKSPDLILADKKVQLFSDDVNAALIKHGFWKGQIWNRRINGETYAVKVRIEAIKDAFNKIQKYVVMILPMAQLDNDKSNDLPEKLHHSNITQLPSKNLFVDRLIYALEKVRRSGAHIAVMLVNVKGFKTFNQHYGFDVGDAILQILASRLKFITRESDYVAHFGADNFAVLLEDLADIQKTNIVAQKILTTVDEPYHVDELSLKPEFSIGVSLYPEDGHGAKQLLERAEFALGQARQDNSSCYFMSSPILNKGAKNWWDAEKNLHNALRNQEFELYYLPQFDLKNDVVSSIECLLRWNHTKRGLVEPRDFIANAEATGFIVAIGDWVIREACFRTAELQRKNIFIPEITINISSRQLDENFVEFLSETAKQNGIELQRIALDLTEDALPTLTHEQKQVLRTLKDHGVKIQIDDFGRGNTSLSMMLECPCDCIKLDQRVIDGILDNPKSGQLCSMVHSLAEVLDFKIIAEGVETDKQVDALRELQCNDVQGHQFSLVLSFSELCEFLNNKTIKRMQHETS